MDAHSSSNPSTPASFIRPPSYPSQPQIPPSSLQQVSQHRVAHQDHIIQQDKLQNAERQARQLHTPHQLLYSPSWANFSSGPPNPLHQLSTAPSHHFSSSSSNPQRDTGALPSDSIKSSAVDSEGIRKGTAATTDGNGGKKGRGPNMNRHQKLTLAKLCCNHSAEYKPGSRVKFWHNMSDLLKQETGYEHRGVQSVVERWVRIRQTELLDREMEPQRNAFTDAIDKFAEQWRHSNKQVAGNAPGSETRDEGDNIVRQAHHGIMMSNAAKQGIIHTGGRDTSYKDKKRDTAPAPTVKQQKPVAAEDRMAESFSRIADFIVGESQGRGRSEEQDGSKRERRKSNSAVDERWERIEAKFDAKMEEFMAMLSNKLDDFFAANRPQ